ncbi:type IX secretion system sortase PorU [Hymenobacter sp. BT188]|uniref:type IX secretion system sortase PorU n=1 Tax=Hymenobacter sp. BT188 TaxID=2763504 RepID=UPI0016518C6C|nr:type IX secretion system sortase PorU [Hymenobacter sp. BT188]MBC6606785.1 type IX secretion system sortase PorU [Hymenobacter sp. BT188]
MRFFWLLLLIGGLAGFANTAQAQATEQTVQASVEWQGYETVYTRTGQASRTPSFRGATYIPTDRVGTYTLRLNGRVVSGQLRNAVYEPFPATDAALLVGANLPPEPALSLRTTTELRAPVSFLSLQPVRRNTQSGQAERLVSFEYTYVAAPATAARGGRPHPSASVLQQGDWFKIGVPTSGIYKLDKAALTAMGLNPQTLDPRRLQLYGNATGMLPQPNSTYRPDDLIENAVFVANDNNDATFNDNEYVLFYARGPHTWEREAPTVNRFRHSYHLYTDTAYYFLTVGTAAGKRIAPAPAVTASPSATITTFAERKFHEIDLINLLKSGRQWLGEKFESGTRLEIPFTIPDLVPGSAVQLTSLVAAASSSASNFQISVGGQNVVSQSVAGYSSNFFPEIANTSLLTAAVPAPGTADLRVLLTYSANSPSAAGYLDYLELNAQRQLRFVAPQLEFRSFDNIGLNAVSRFTVANATGVTVWDVTNPRRPVARPLDAGGAFVAPTDSLREFIAFSGSSFEAPRNFGRIAPQNLHALNLDGRLDFVIVTHPLFRAEAERLADYRRNPARSVDKLNVAVVTTEQIYNEFSSGGQDVTAIRDFMKMIYDRTPAGKRTMLLLFGDASYDYKSDPTNDLTKVPAWWKQRRLSESGSPDIDRINQNFVPVYESRESFNRVFPRPGAPALSYSSDDYFGLLDDDEGRWDEGGRPTSEGLDIGIGRLPVRTPTDQPRSTAQAKLVVDKLITYDSPAAYGKWRNRVTFVADDGDANEHVLSSTEPLANDLITRRPAYNVHKVYLDMYPQVAGAGGQNSPGASRTIDEAIEQGSLIVNYAGHGGVRGWTDEQIFTKSDVLNLENVTRPTFMLTATCDFSTYDDPEFDSAGEVALTNVTGGAIGLLTTTRVVISTFNRFLNERFFAVVFAPVNGRMPRLGDVMALTKNSSQAGDNNRNFSLLGDPSARLAYPEQSAAIRQLNGKPIATANDTLRALSRVDLTGDVTTAAGTIDAGFSGKVQVTVFEKPSTITLLGNEINDGRPTIAVQRDIIYDGQASVRNGEFKLTFVVPKDINYSFGQGKISLYAADTVRRADASGATNLVVGGVLDNAAADTIPPDIRLFMDTESFVFGGLTSTSTTLISRLRDDNGINTAGSGIGHEITATLDNDVSKLVVLNDYYTAEVDSFQVGRVRYLFKDLTPGPHLLRVKAWDTFNNSAEKEIEFIAARTEKLALNHVLNYPNPFSSATTFHFDHNRTGDDLDIQVQIFTVSGKLVRTLRTTAIGSSSHLSDVIWDGRDEFNDQLARGVYVYRVSVRSPRDGSTASKYEKLVLLN